MGKSRWMRIAEDLEGEQEEEGQGCNAVSDQTHACKFKKHLSKVYRWGSSIEER